MSVKLRIGLLGGSFNPAHEGHLHISQEALKRLKLDQVWWLVSPQNPLKSTSNMASYAERFAYAQKVTQHDRRIKISDFEKKNSLTYTYETLSEIKKHYPKIKFVWIMGADNLPTFHLWQKWREIIKVMPMVIFDRAPFSHTGLRARAWQSLRKFRLPENDIAAIADKPKHWAYMYILSRRHPASSTEIRANKKLLQ